MTSLTIMHLVCRHIEGAVFAQRDREPIEKQFREVATNLGRSDPKVAEMLTDTQGGTLEIGGFPRLHWRQI